MSAFEFPIRVYIEDTDAGGIVYYVNYLKFMERARTEMMRSLGFGKTSIFSVDKMFVVQSVQADYLAPAKLDDQLRVTAQLIKSGAAYLQLKQEVFCGAELLCRGEVKIVCVDKQTMRPSVMPHEIRQALQADS
ncbi:4-hydroxybenzoyl-CoA thioesterase/acyl-CoA thioester hydrolase [Sinobacterium caligoides]|uniref:4-hydroxybenzoyl-CoA thioesterase/acyl-CoA thioester hydrolase n=1 Tax=Sinobacterium caligoides TaxID=933926 RepID=A0A3N2DFZ0_9GAMM|nr:tol-pal system-associated acyl-CoA thioesterase [Sinobacterium caligoides]ROR98725.1 4-hydroxybenzoyl-CoA thioesterase/acyl-CoA thioester hydrolase [Sinobacterium caligoides]